jgi:hypothetical protein
MRDVYKMFGVINEQDTIEVINLMLKYLRKETASTALKP